MPEVFDGRCYATRSHLAARWASATAVAFLSAASSAEEASRSAIETIIVTAERRAQNVQDIPAAVTALTAEDLEIRNIETPQDLQQVTPGLSIAESHVGGVARVTIRGVGMENLLAGGDPGVPIHINGHYTQSTAYVLRDFVDVERVEVQRGPQGTLYGRNAVGGNINIITKRPTETFEARGTVEIGNYDQQLLQGVVSGPITERLRGRAVISDNRRDGYVDDEGIDEDREDSDYTSLRGMLEYDLTDNVQLLVAAYDFDDESSRGAVRTITPAASYDVDDPYVVRTNYPSDQHDRSHGGSVDLIWALGNVEFRSLSAYDSTSKIGATDVDGTDVSRSDEVDSGSDYDTFSQEFQLVSTGSGPWQWVTGVFFYSEDSEAHYHAFFDYGYSVSPVWDTNGDGVLNASDPRVEINTSTDIESTSIAAYGHVQYALSEQLEIIVGARYTQDEKELDELGYILTEDRSPNLAPFQLPPTSAAQQDHSWNKFTGNLGVNYHVTDQAMLYASWSRGYKAGGLYFSGMQGAYDPETVDALEGGLKSRWLDDRLQVNIAAFAYDYEDRQEFQRLPPPQGYQIRNAASVESYGVEIESIAYLTDALHMDVAVGYLNAEYEEFESIDAAQPLLGLQDLSGNDVPRSPPWKVHVGGEYLLALPGDLGSLLFRADYTWVDEQWSNAFNRDGTNPPLLGEGDRTPSYDQVDARIVWTSVSGAWLAELFGRNLTDEDNISNSFADTPDRTFVTYFPPRTYGLRVSYAMGD